MKHVKIYENLDYNREDKLDELRDEFTYSGDNQDLIDEFQSLRDKFKDRFFALCNDNNIEIDDQVATYFYTVVWEDIENY